MCHALWLIRSSIVTAITIMCVASRIGERAPIIKKLPISTTVDALFPFQFFLPWTLFRLTLSKFSLWICITYMVFGTKLIQLFDRVPNCMSKRCNLSNQCCLFSKRVQIGRLKVLCGSLFKLQPEQQRLYFKDNVSCAWK